MVLIVCPESKTEKHNAGVGFLNSISWLSEHPTKHRGILKQLTEDVYGSINSGLRHNRSDQTRLREKMPSRFHRQHWMAVMFLSVQQNCTGDTLTLGAFRFELQHLTHEHKQFNQQKSERNSCWSWSLPPFLLFTGRCVQRFSARMVRKKKLRM